MVIRVRDIATAADTNEQGSAVHARLVEALARQENVIVSFDGIATATSSFVNACFVDLLSSLSFEDIKRRVRVVQATRQIAAMIKLRLSSAAKPAAA